MPLSTESQQRREAISAILERGPVENQQSLVDALRRRNLDATQSSVSRDLKTLGAIKTTRGYELPAKDASNDLFDDVAVHVRGLRPAGPNLLVIRTATGAAQRVGLAIDRSAWTDVVGNISGDDTVFVATESAQAQRAVISRLAAIGITTEFTS